MSRYSTSYQTVAICFSLFCGELVSLCECDISLPSAAVTTVETHIASCLAEQVFISMNRKVNWRPVCATVHWYRTEIQGEKINSYSEVLSSRRKRAAKDSH